MKRTYHTKCKTYIMNYLKNHSSKRFSAQDIFSYIEKEGGTVNIATIYRNLDNLVNNEILMKYKTAEDDRCLYQYVEPHSGCHSHLHIQCKKCGKISHLDCDAMEEFQRHLMGHHGFVLECQTSILTGICSDCGKEKSDEK